MDESLHIESVAYGGQGVAKVDGCVYFVDGGLPGDTVTAKTYFRGKSFRKAALTNILKASTYRSEARCRFAGSCGGCDWSSVAYQQQLDWKLGFLRDSLMRVGKVTPLPEISVEASSLECGYRSRVRLHLHVTAEGVFRVGFLKKYSHALAAIDRCVVASEAINNLIGKISEISDKRLSGFKASIAVQEYANQKLSCTLLSKGSRGDRLLEKIIAPHCNWVGSISDVKSAPDFMIEDSEGIKYLSSPGQFSQANTGTNIKLRQYLCAKVSQLKPEILWDLFCGYGNFTLPLSKLVRRVRAVELNVRSLASADRAAAKNQLENIEFYAGDCSDFLRLKELASETPDFILLDPPREGAKLLMPEIIKRAPKWVGYVSCDPATLSRDLRVLLDGGYRILEAKVWDFFPDTFHLETSVLLEKSV